MTHFTIKILNQEWISKNDSRKDLCSHGKFELIIKNVKILCENDELDWTINTSTLNLLRCIESNHIANENYDLILHCGELLMLSCPIGIYLDLTHENDLIKIKNIKKQFGVSDNDFIEFSNLSVEIPKIDFAKQVLNVAEEVKDFFKKQPERIFDNENDKMLWKDFWEEFNELYENGIKKYYC
ncbi:hypothetical protein G4D82_09735 [Flavobacterium sp. CYK-4]|uniref:hypothetical protein n=1 Tax=Flavobacterium lotistagni TaxID=2709660 RepID=UPI001407CC77|nr:hypothetical protein [Flavobacterium lotistagni]NHM07500.1 hypothetical protein [Flavobacterium lotistagni]